MQCQNIATQIRPLDAWSPGDESERALIENARSGSATAFQELFERPDCSGHESAYEALWHLFPQIDHKVQPTNKDCNAADVIP